MRFFIGLVIALLFIATLISFIKPEQSQEPLSVTPVGTYKNCNVLRLSIPAEARYHYLLECPVEKVAQP